MFSFDFCVQLDHPSLEGHFPGNPVVPGVIIIDEIVRGISKHDLNTKVTNISSIKFLKPIKPGDIVQVNVVEKKTVILQFVCSIDEAIIVSGQLRTE